MMLVIYKHKVCLVEKLNEFVTKFLIILLNDSCKDFNLA